MIKNHSNNPFFIICEKKDVINCFFFVFFFFGLIITCEIVRWKSVFGGSDGRETARENRLRIPLSPGRDQEMDGNVHRRSPARIHRSGRITAQRRLPRQTRPSIPATIGYSPIPIFKHLIITRARIYKHL